MNNSSLVISHDSNELSVDEAIITYTDYSDGFKYVIEDVIIKPADFKNFIIELEAELGKLHDFDYSRNKNQIFKKVQNDKVRSYFRGNAMDMFGTIYSNSEQVSHFIWKTYLKYCKLDNSVDIFVRSYYMNGQKLEDNTKQIKAEDLTYINDKYYPYIDTSVMFDQFFTCKENILLVVGEPGLGKSKLSSLAIKHALNNTEKLPYDKILDNPSLDNQHINVVFVKSPDVLVVDKFWRNLEQEQADFVIIDDLDYMLTKRDAEVMSTEDVNKNTFLNQFLSYTDGVEKHKTKFIITTNQPYCDIDSALLRKGRLFDILELRKLDQHEAEAIWLDNNLSLDEFKLIFKTHEVLPAELGSEIDKRLNARIENATSPYLKEEGISKVERAGRVKHIGLS